MAVIVSQIFAVHPPVIFPLFVCQSPRHGLIPPVPCTCIITVSTGRLGRVLILPFAAEAMEFLVRRYEWSSRPVGLLKAASRCPVVSIPNAGEHVHPLLSREHIACSLSVPVDSQWNLIHEKHNLMSVPEDRVSVKLCRWIEPEDMPLLPSTHTI